MVQGHGSRGPGVLQGNGIMALAHAILTTLLDDRLTGYQLAKRFDASIGFFWRASHQQIYQELYRLARDGFVKGSVVEQADRPNRIPYAITAKGRRRLLDWAAEPRPPATVKDDLLVKCQALALIPPAELRAQILARRGHHPSRLEAYGRGAPKVFPPPAALPREAPRTSTTPRARPPPHPPPPPPSPPPRPP